MHLIEEYDESILGHLIEELKFQAILNFISFECVYASRECNAVQQLMSWLV